MTEDVFPHWPLWLDYQPEPDRLSTGQTILDGRRYVVYIAEFLDTDDGFVTILSVSTPTHDERTWDHWKHIQRRENLLEAEARTVAQDYRDRLDVYAVLGVL